MEINHFLEENEINYKNTKLYIEAFTHMSFINESKIDESNASYQRLEFLGDVILSQIVATYIFKNCEIMEPGEMTLLRSYLVNKTFLSNVGKKLKFEKYIRIGNGKIEEILSDTVYEDVFESLVGAIYLDAGYEEVRKFVEKHICQKILKLDFSELKDYKTRLQEYLQSSHGKTVIYSTKQKKVDNNDNIFTSMVTFDNKILGRGKGTSKKSAEQDAARDAYERMAK